MARTRIEDLPKDTKISRAELRAIMGGEGGGMCMPGTAPQVESQTNEDEGGEGTYYCLNKTMHCRETNPNSGTSWAPACGSCDAPNGRMD